MDEGLLERNVDKCFLIEMQKFNFHHCGEKGEFHTFVTGGSIFEKLIKVTPGKKEKRDDMWFLEISAKLE